MIRILSGWSNPGGSTVAFINLTNALNEFGHDTVFYGPHSWHLGKCKSEQYTQNSKMKLNKEDILIVHFRNNFIQRPPIKGFFLSCHEQDIFPLKNIKYEIFDKIHYVSEHQRKFHGIDHPYFILPNILEDLKPNDKPKEKIGGIIGSIDRNKQVHVSIKKALSDGCEKIYIYGLITDPWYWQNEVANLVDGEKVIYKGYEDNKQNIYDSITDVYHSSILETWGYIKGECKLTNTLFHGNISTNGYWEMSKEEIINNWIKEIEYERK
jgi:hypothetical protein